jgi:hypothetical protein
LNPAVPPPPVAGASVGIAPTECVRVADGWALRVADRRALRVADGCALWVADGLALGALDVTVGLGEMLDDFEVGAPGDKLGSVARCDPEHATTDAVATTAAKLTAISLTLNRVPAVVARIFMGLPIPAADGGRSRPRHIRYRRLPFASSLPAPADGRSHEAPTEIRRTDGYKELFECTIACLSLNH